MLAIRNFGTLWERRYIFFGRSRVAGALWGYNANHSGRVDFREQSGVYVLYDRDRVPVYVGQAGRGNSRLWHRLRTHTNDHLWNRWEHFSWFGLCKVNRNGTLSLADRPDRRLGGRSRDALDEIEAVLI